MPRAAAKSESETPSIDLATAQERARIVANHERYEARTSGKSSAEVNEEERKKAAENAPEAPAAAPGGGQTLPPYEADGKPASGAVRDELGETEAESSSSTSSSTSSSSSGSGS